MLNRFPSNRMGIGVAGTFKAQDYTDAGYTGVSLSAFNGSIPAGKQVVGQYTIPSWRGGKGGGGRQYFVVADAPKPQQQAAPAAAAPAPAPTQNLQIAKLTEQSEAYRKQAEQSIAEGQSRIAELENEELQRQKATELQNRLAIQAASSQARGATQANLKIGAASDTSRTAGTSAFKRRRDQMRLAPIQSTAGINAPASSVLNV
jgi:hypothetical protein